MIKNNRYIKLTLVIITEAIVVWFTEVFSTYIFPLHYTTLTYLILGSLLAYTTTKIYDHILKRKKERVEKEIQDLTKFVLKRIH